MFYIELLLTITGIHMALGFLFGLVFIFTGLSRIDSAARNTGIGFKLIILPGIMVFWPLLAYRWFLGKKPVENNAHRAAARAKQTGGVS